MTFTELSKKIATCYNSLPALVSTLRDGFANIEGGGGGGSSDIEYSTEEKKIGKWIDGNNLYQKTFNITPTSSDTIIDIASLNINELIHRFGAFTRNTASGIQQKAIECRTESPSDNTYGIQCELRGTNLFIAINGYTYSEITKIRVTIQYTKNA